MLLPGGWGWPGFEFATPTRMSHGKGQLPRSDGSPVGRRHARWVQRDYHSSGSRAGNPGQSRGYPPNSGGTLVAFRVDGYKRMPGRAGPTVICRRPCLYPSLPRRPAS